ncbi:LysE/ArgO family amino acid transporter [Pseudoalteromonas xiamenensis]|uniref:Amino acid transporter n=1 Tax=Pseudoalteromonas xiamenensis TaxID=882626 RepID=A0A975HK91_9GAMM|nr:LysE/ArgO family amino acid transporter [Pseudoalteromonas xiamenensis]QTH70677.1 amino acid transporter [Pseudoalteromonas xiamenensis]
MVWFEGFFLSLGLIAAIGAQNAFVISQSLSGKFTLPVILTVSLCDMFLVSLGVLGVGALIQQSEWLLQITTWAGIAFLSVYGAMSLKSALSSKQLESEARSVATRKRAILTAMAVSLLNPHAYLDTVVILGGVAGKFADQQKLWFVLGCISASIAWFMLLGFGAKQLAPVFRNPKAWKVLDVLVCIMMWSIALSLLHFTQAN